MTLADIVSITGMGGLFEVTARRNDGLIVTSLADNKTTFVSGRNHLFTSLDNITLYTTGDGVMLKDVLAEMQKQQATNDPAAAKTDADVKAYIEKVIPDYDREKVYVSDMKKLLKWYQLLAGKNLLEELLKEEEAPTGEEGTAAADAELFPAEEGAPKKKAAAKAKDDTKVKKEAKPKSTVDKSAKAASKPAAPVKKITTPRKAS